MEPKTAIKLLDRMQNPDPWEPRLTKDAFEALKMAKAALRQEVGTVGKSCTAGRFCSCCGRPLSRSYQAGAIYEFCPRCGIVTELRSEDGGGQMEIM